MDSVADELLRGLEREGAYLADQAEMRRLEQEIFAENCAGCHGENGEGSAELGAPALDNDIWLYGGDKGSIVETISESRGGVMPAWGRILDAVTIKKLAIYIHALGGGD